MHYIEYLKAVLKHKYYMFLFSFQLKVPIYLALFHDSSKFTLEELIPYADYFNGTKKDKQAFDQAWLFHTRRNKHHWQFWILCYDSEVEKINCLEMPEVYVREMVADWKAAGKAYGNPNTPEWYAQNRSNILLHPKTKQLVETLLVR
jgi:hypothetical protein